MTGGIYEQDPVFLSAVQVINQVIAKVEKEKEEREKMDREFNKMHSPSRRRGR